MVFNTRSGRPVGSRWAAKCREPTARVEGAILFRSPERGDPVSGARARGLLSVAESALTTKVGSSTRGPPIAPCDPVPWHAWRPVEAGRSGGMHKGGGWASRGPTRPCPSNNKLGRRVVFGGEKVYFCLAKDLPDLLNHLRMEHPLLWGDIAPR